MLGPLDDCVVVEIKADDSPVRFRFPWLLLNRYSAVALIEGDDAVAVRVLDAV